MIQRVKFCFLYFLFLNPTFIYAKVQENRPIKVVKFKRNQLNADINDTRKAAYSGDPNAMYDLSEWYLRNGEDNLAQAWRKKAVEAGANNIKKIEDSEFIYSSAIEDFNNNSTKALLKYYELAEAGNANAMIIVGNAFADGWGTIINKTEAYKWYDKALKINKNLSNEINLNSEIGSLYLAEKGDPTDMLIMALNFNDKEYAFGIETDILYDLKKARYWYQKTLDADPTNPIAMYLFANSFSEEYNETDHRKAKDLFHRLYKTNKDEFLKLWGYFGGSDAIDVLEDHASLGDWQAICKICSESSHYYFSSESCNKLLKGIKLAKSKGKINAQEAKVVYDKVSEAKLEAEEREEREARKEAQNAEYAQTNNNNFNETKQRFAGVWRCSNNITQFKFDSNLNGWYRNGSGMAWQTMRVTYKGYLRVQVYDAHSVSNLEISGRTMKLNGVWEYHR